MFLDCKACYWRIWEDINNLADADLFWLFLVLDVPVIKGTWKVSLLALFSDDEYDYIATHPCNSFCCNDQMMYGNNGHGVEVIHQCSDRERLVLALLYGG